MPAWIRPAGEFIMAGDARTGRTASIARSFGSCVQLVANAINRNLVHAEKKGCGWAWRLAAVAPIAYVVKHHR